MRKNKLLLLLVLLTMLSTRAVAQDDASAMREQMKERLDELKALAPDNVKGLNETLKNDTVKMYTAQYTQLYNASPLESYDDYQEAYDFLGHIIFRVNEYLAAYREFTDNMAKLKTLIQNFNADTEKKQEYKDFAQNVYNAYKALSKHDMIALTDENVEAQKEYDDNEYNYVPDDVTSENIADVEGNPSEYISTYGQFNAFFSQNTKELGSIYLKVAGTGTAESPEILTAQLRNPNLENADEQWWGTEWTSIGNSAAEQSGKPFDTYQQVHLPSGYYTLVGYGMDRRGSWADVLAHDEDWNEDHRTYLFSHLDIDGSDSTMVDAFKAKNMALTADITEGAGNISTCEVDGVTYYTPNSMAQYRAWEDAKIAMAGQGHAAVVQFWVWQDEGDFGTLGFAHPWHADNTWFVADGIQLYYATDNFPNINIDTPDCASVTITDDGWATFYTDKALAFSGIKGLTAYTAKRDGSTVTLTPVDNVPANTGVVLKGDAKTYNIPIIASSTTDKGDLQGSATTATAFDAHDAVGGIYVLGLNDTNEAQFEKKTSGNVPARQPYLLVPTAEEPSSPLLVVIAGEPAEPTYAVEFAEGTEESDKWTAEPNTGVKKGETVTVTYTGSKKVIGVKAEKKGAPAEEPMTLGTPLTIEAITDGTIVVNIEGTLSTGMKYSVNGGTKTTITETTNIQGLKAGDKVQFYGNGTQTQVYGVYGDEPNVKILGSGDGFQTKVYGNMMSLLDEEGFATKTDLPDATFVFSGLFSENTTLTDASELLLPATTLATGCYYGMFNGCTSLTTAPKLPATTMATGCYRGMFEGCTSLTTAPKLPATTLAKSCYYTMFFNCTSLTSAYVKAAYTEENGECDYMFDLSKAAGAVLHTTPDNKASWETMMGTGKDWKNWTVADDWEE